jgi:hypothetical protein
MPGPEEPQFILVLLRGPEIRRTANDPGRKHAAKKVNLVTPRVYSVAH